MYLSHKCTLNEEIHPVNKISLIREKSCAGFSHTSALNDASAKLVFKQIQRARKLVIFWFKCVK